MFTSFVLFVYLQLMDVLTTVAFLLRGGKEANPIVRLAMEASPSPLAALALVKLLALGLGVYCWRARRRLLSLLNAFFAAVVLWNVLAIILGVAH